MFIHLDASGGVPLYAQVLQQLRERIMSGRMAQGEQLPSVRELSTRLKVNPLTVAKVYQLLQQEGLVDLQRGRGTYVAAHVGRMRSLAAKRRSIAPAVRRLVAEAQHLQVSREELAQLIDEQIRELSKI